MSAENAKLYHNARTENTTRVPTKHKIDFRVMKNNKYKIESRFSPPHLNREYFSRHLAPPSVLGSCTTWPCGN